MSDKGKGQRNFTPEVIQLKGIKELPCEVITESVSDFIPDHVLYEAFPQDQGWSWVVICG